MNEMNVNKEKACSFTGHRILPEDKLSSIARTLGKEIVKKIEAGYTDFICGGAIGFDTMAAAIVINLKSSYPGIRLILAIPNENQSAKWSFSEKTLYNDILKNADVKVVISKEYTKTCMAERNRFMIDNSSFCIAYLEKNTGGSYNTVKYAERNGVPYINIATII